VFESVDIAHNAGATVVESALEAMSTVGDVVVTGSGPWVVTFIQNHGDLELLKFSSGAGTVSETTKGWGKPEVQKVSLSAGSSLGGTFTLTVSGQTTSALSFDATEAQVKSAIETALNTIEVTVSKSASTSTQKTFLIVFTKGYPNHLDDFPGSLQLMQLDASSITPASATTSLSRENQGALLHARGGLSEGKAYRFYVESVNAVGTSKASPMVSVFAASVPAAAAAPAVTDISSSQASLTWSSPSSNVGTPLTGFVFDSVFGYASKLPHLKAC
jgi:hypothetical protein